MQKHRPGKGGADLLGGDQFLLTKTTRFCPFFDDLTGYRTLHLMAHGVRPELATMLAALAFGGGAQ